MDTRRVLADVTHRPWPLPSGPWVMAQSWIDLLFAHWPVDADQLRAIVPASIPIDTFDGTAWLGITPFELIGLRPRGLPALSRFPELNVRTYTVLDGKPGIWFFSLDAGSLAAVWGARLTYRLPYFRARMTIARERAIRYRSVRADARFEAAYAPAGPASASTPGTLEHWLTERYCLYTRLRGRVLRAEIHHPPWPLQPATATIGVNTMAPFTLPPVEPLVHYARRQDVLIWPLRRV